VTSTNGVHGHIETVILTALAEETEAVVRSLDNSVVHPWRGNDLHVGEVSGKNVLVFPLGAMGNASSAQAAQRAIGIWNPAQIMIVGITGGARGAGDDLRLGDVLVPDQVIGYEHAKVTPTGPETRYETYRPSHELLTAARSVNPAEWALSIVTPRPDGDSGRTLPRVHVGPVLSGEKVVADATTMNGLLRDWPKALGVEMEGLGVAIASYRGGPGFLLVKAVCDFADPAKEDSWHGYAAEAAARFAVAVLTRIHDATDNGLRPQAVPMTGEVRYPGPVRLEVCRRLDNWEEVADYFDVPGHIRARFGRGHEPRRLWDFLDNRRKLYELPQALEAAGRADLASLLRQVPS